MFEKDSALFFFFEKKLVCKHKPNCYFVVDIYSAANQRIVLSFECNCFF